VPRRLRRPRARGPWLLLGLAVLGGAWRAGEAAPLAEAGLLAALQTECATPGAGPVQRDPGLDATAQALCTDAQEIAALARSGRTPPRVLDSERLRFHLDMQGVLDAGVVPFLQWGPAERARDELRRALRGPQAAGRVRPSHFGLAAVPGADGALCVATLLLRRWVRLQPLQRELLAPGPLQLRGALEFGAAAPRVVFTDPAGGVHEAPVATGAGRFTGELELPELRGTYRVEVLVDTERGPTVAALFPLHLGVAAPRLPVLRILPSGEERVSEAELEAQALERIAAARDAAGLPKLIADASLADVARHFARAMLERGFFGHKDPEGRDAEDRLRAAGQDFDRVAENLSLAPSLVEADESLLASPAHRRNVLDPEMSHVGVGVLRSPAPGAGVLLVQLFVRRPQAPQPDAARELQRALRSARRARGLPDPRRDPALDRGARALLRHLDPSDEWEPAAARALLLRRAALAAGLPEDLAISAWLLQEERLPPLDLSSAEGLLRAERLGLAQARRSVGAPPRSQTLLLMLWRSARGSERLR